MTTGDGAMKAFTQDLHPKPPASHSGPFQWAL